MPSPFSVLLIEVVTIGADTVEYSKECVKHFVHQGVDYRDVGG